MAEDLARQGAAIPAVEPAAEVDPRIDKEAPLVTHAPAAGPRRLYRARFALAYLGLALAGGIAAGATLWLLDRPAEPASAPWSEWQPTGRESSYVQQIAVHVGGKYRHPSGNQLVGVKTAWPIVIPREEGDLLISTALIQNDPRGDRGDISVVDISDDVLYVLCGAGAQCSIREGEPSVARWRLLRREALELALYTFKYTDANNVVTIMPPTLEVSLRGEPQVVARALFFQENDFRQVLERPIRRLFPTPPPFAQQLSDVEGARIDELTGAHIFRYQFTQAQDETGVIQLVPTAA